MRKPVWIKSTVVLSAASLLVLAAIPVARAAGVPNSTPIASLAGSGAGSGAGSDDQAITSEVMSETIEEMMAESHEVAQRGNRGGGGGRGQRGGGRDNSALSTADMSDLRGDPRR